jgi:uncharacterized membrane protein
LFDPIRFHLAINHFPIFSLFIGIAVLLFGVLSNKQLIIQVALAVLFFSGIIGIGVHFSGEEAEHTVKSLAGTSKHFLEEHEELGETSFIAGIILSLLSLALYLIIQFTEKKIRSALWILIVCGMIVFGLYYSTAAHGGKIRHVELRE